MNRICQKYIYLCGPVTGRPEQEVEKHFFNVETTIAQKAKAEGVAIKTFSPPDFPCKDLPWEAAMKHCIKQLVDCDGVAVLQGWHRSKGCLLELEIAGRLKIPVVYVESPLNEFGLMEFSKHPISSDIIRYYKKSYFLAEQNLPEQPERAGDIALLETANRYLDPYGFEYIDKEGEE